MSRVRGIAQRYVCEGRGEMKEVKGQWLYAEPRDGNEGGCDYVSG